MAGGKGGGVGEDDVGEVLADVALEFVGSCIADLNCETVCWVVQPLGDMGGE